MIVKTFVTVGCVVSLGLASCSNTSALLAKSELLAAQNNHFQAYWVIAHATERYPEDAELQRVFWERRRDYLLEQGRELLYHERERDAIGVFRKVFALEPDSPVAKGWIARAWVKLAKRDVEAGDMLAHQGRLEEALKSYNAALSYVPEFPPATLGIESVNEHFDKKIEKAAEHYRLGSRARGAHPPSYHRSAYHSGIALEMDRSLKRAERLQSTSKQRLARDRMELALQAEDEGFHAGALSECLKIKGIQPDYEGLDQRIARLEKEVNARQKCRAAEMALRKSDFELADKLLAEAFDEAVSGDVKTIVSSVMQRSKNRRYHEAFLRARDLELDWKLDDALAGFQVIEKAFAKDYPADEEEGFEGATRRITEIKAILTEAKDAFDKGAVAEKAGKLKEAIDHYTEAAAVHPDYRDLAARIVELRAKL